MRWEMTGNGMRWAEFKHGDDKLRLTAYARNIVRVTQTRRDSFVLRDEPMIIAKPERELQLSLSGIGRFVAKDGVITIDIGDMQLRFHTRTGALTYYGGGKCAMREPKARGRVLEEMDVIKNRFDPNEPSVEHITADGPKLYANGTPYVDRKAYHTRIAFELSPDEAIYGLGQHEQGVLNYRGQHQFLYQHNFKISCPVLFSSNGWALLYNSCSYMTFHDDAFGTYLSADADDELDYFVIFGHDFDKLISGIRFLTGDAPIPPRWAFGYVQSREHYHTQQELLDTAKEFRSRHIPLDCIVQDWQTWPKGMWGQKSVDSERYPDLSGATSALHYMHVRLMWSIWPNLSGDGPNRAEMLDAGHMLGNRSTYDAFDPDARAIYWRQAEEGLFDKGVDAWWCDCSEPFESGWGGPYDLLPEERASMCVDAFKRYIDPTMINAYSIYHSRGMYEGQRNERNARMGKRVVNLTRSGFPGQQRYGTFCWNGDLSARWDVLQRSVPEGLNFCLSGQPYWTVDAGGFFVKKWEQWFGAGEYEDGCKDDGYRELYTRWLQLSAFLPMMRSHGTDTPREPWQFGAPGEVYYDAIVGAIELRYQFVPYLYSIAADVYFNRYTMLRMLAFDFMHDPVALNVKDEFMLGNALLVCPILEPLKDGAYTRRVYLPAGVDWYDFWTNERCHGGQWIEYKSDMAKLQSGHDIPLYVRAGTIIPVAKPALSTDEQVNTPFELRVYSDGEQCVFKLYRDSGDGYGYEDSRYMRVIYRWMPGMTTVVERGIGDIHFAPPKPSVVIIGDDK